MKYFQKKEFTIFLILFIIILCGGLAVLIWNEKPMPVALVQEYGFEKLWREAEIMNECAECHKAVDFHDCTTCHDDHGSVKLAGIRFYEVIELTGDVPEHMFVRVNEIIPNQETFGTHILLFDFLDQHGIDQFESITFITNDGGLTTIEKQYLDKTAMLVPYMDGVRFVTESVHQSTWLKGIKRIIIIGTETPLVIDGEPTSIGRLLLTNTIRLTIEGTDTMLTNEVGQTGYAYVANWIEGAQLLNLLNNQNPSQISINTLEGETIILKKGEFENAIIAIVRRETTLVLPDRGRSAWITNIIEIQSN